MEQVYRDDVSFSPSSSSKLSGPSVREAAAGKRRRFQETRRQVHRVVRRRSEEWVGTFSAVKEVERAALEAGEGMGSFGGPPADMSPAGNHRKSDHYMVVDEEELFNMPVLMNSMAEGLILTPPALKRGFNWNDVSLECAVDLTLWVD